MGFASNRNQARQMVGHGYFVVNNRRLNIPSSRLKVGDVVQLVEDKQKLSYIQENLTKISHKGILAWIELDSSAFKAKLLHIPVRDEIPLAAKEQLIIELYSK
jgi:small subunit ribosomal protein S4